MCCLPVNDGSNLCRIYGRRSRAPSTRPLSLLVLELASRRGTVKQSRVMRAGPYEATEHFKTLLIRENLIKDDRTLEWVSETTYIHEASVARQDDGGFMTEGRRTCLETCVEQVHQHTNIPEENPGVTLPNCHELRGQMPADLEWYTYASKRCLLLTGPNAERF